MFKVGDRVRIVKHRVAMAYSVVGLTGTIHKILNNSNSFYDYMFVADPEFEGTPGLHFGVDTTLSSRLGHNVYHDCLELLKRKETKKTKFAEWMKDSGDRYV